ncbi:MAG: hypothetical protein ABH858_06705 [Candidatus Omnitrophota bacterium]
MAKKYTKEIYDYISIGVIVLITLLSLMRFNYLPQFIDGYYHLSAANGLERSGGWIGHDWWNFAPVGRPHLYPPLYHLLIIFIKSAGITGIDAVRITEVLFVPIFFLIVCCVFRRHISSLFAFLVLIIASSFFSFYSSLSGNIPASLAVLWGILCWYYLKKDRILASAIFLTLAFYTHAAIPWIFLFSLLILACFSPNWRRSCLLIISFSLGLAAPIIYHQAKHLDYLNFSILSEVNFSHYSIGVLIFGFVSFFSCLRRKSFFCLLFIGYLLGSMIVFFKYPYRLFSAQGILGFVFLSACLGEEIISKLGGRKGYLATTCIFLYFLFFHSTVDLDNGQIKFHLLNSTYYNIASGNFPATLEFNSLFFPNYYDPIVEVIKRNTQKDDIIVSNLGIASRIFSALSNRPVAASMLGEVKEFSRFEPYPAAKLIVWLKPKDEEFYYWRHKLNLAEIYQNEIAYVFINPFYTAAAVPLKAKLSFAAIDFIFMSVILILILDISGLVKRVFMKTKKIEDI